MTASRTDVPEINDHSDNENGDTPEASLEISEQSKNKEVIDVDKPSDEGGTEDETPNEQLRAYSRPNASMLKAKAYHRLDRTNDEGVDITDLRILWTRSINRDHRWAVFPCIQMFGTRLQGYRSTIP